MPTGFWQFHFQLIFCDRFLHSLLVFEISASFCFSLVSSGSANFALERRQYLNPAPQFTALLLLPVFLSLSSWMTFV